MSPRASLTVARTADVPLFARCPPVHSVLLGSCRLEVEGRVVDAPGTNAMPANVPHTVLELHGPFAGVAYLDARRYRYEDARRLADAWRGFVPGCDDLRELMGDALKVPERRVDPRLLRVLEAFEREPVSVADAAAQVGLSESRLAHLMTETLGAPPRLWRTWSTLRRALGEAILGEVNLTEAAHRAGFADSAHLSRTCRQLTGVRPAQMLPGTVHVIS